MLFKNAKLMQAAVFMMSFLGIKEIPIADGKVNLQDDQQTKLKEELTEKTFNSLIEAFNKDLAENKETESIRASVEDLLKETEISQEALDQIIADAKANGGNDTLAIVKAIKTELSTYKVDLANQKEMIKKLIDTAEDDTPEALLKNKMEKGFKHSLTHAFGSNKDYDAVDGRGWNQALTKGLSASNTDYADPVVINKLNGDADLYFRENPTEIKSLHRDNFMLPDFWPKRLNVSDKVTSAVVLTAEITQGRKFNFLPKNVQEIEAEEGKIYPVQIDAEWNGFQLQEIETSWLNMMNKEGSQPEKMSFVRFLVGELMKRARVEDRISSLNGIFVQTPKGADKAGKFINRQNGLFYQLWKARDINKKYRAFAMGPITSQNVYDYFHSDDEANLGFLKRLDQEVLAMTNLVVYVHYKVWVWYKAKYKEINGTNMDYKGLPEHFEDHPNIRVVTFVDQENPNFVFATFDDNIEILENIPAEKSAYRFQTLLRIIYLLGDYKLGIRLIHIGREVREGDPNEFKVQSVWSNDAPIFLEEKYIPAFDTTTGKLSVPYKNVQVDETWKTDITEFTDVKPGQLIKIRGNANMLVSKSVKDGAKIDLVGNADFNLQLGGTLTLYVKSDLTVMEINRTGAPAGLPSTDVEFNDDVINANAGTKFIYTGAADETLDDITGGTEDKVIRIYGNDIANVDFTIETITGKVNVGGTPIVLSDDSHYLELVSVAGVWYKTTSVTA